MIKMHLLAGLLALLTASCTVNFMLSSPPVEVDPAYLNNQVRLVTVPLWPMKTNQFLSLILEYRTDNEVVFPGDFNLTVFIQSDGSWMEIDDLTTGIPSESVFLSPNDPSSYGQIVTFWPRLNDLNKVYCMRVYIFGDMKTSEGIKVVSAFADFTVRP